MEERYITKILAHNLKFYRKNFGVTQYDLAEQAKISCRQYQKLEAGTANATLDTLNNLAKVFLVTIDRLLQLSFYRTSLSPELYLKEFKLKFQDEQFGVGVRDLDGVVLWVNQYASELQNRGLTFPQGPLDLLQKLTSTATETLQNRLISEKDGIFEPYINSIKDKDMGNDSYLRYYPTLILPQKGSTPFYATVCMVTTLADCQENYYNYCKNLISIV